MEYLTVAQARNLPGLRLVLTAGVPGPWGESAKAIFEYKGIEYSPVRQEAGLANEELQAWTGQNSAPVAILDDLPPRCGWLELLQLAETLAPDKPLLPSNLEERALVVGLSSELAGEGGFAWNRRLQMLAPLMRAEKTPAGVQRMAQKYGWSEAACAAAAPKVAACLDYFAARLRSQQHLRSDYLVGTQLSAADLYLANFLAMVKPLPPEQNPMPAYMRSSYEAVEPALAPHLVPVLFEYRDEIYRRHITLPLEF